MAGAKINREILGVFMESPLYFNMPLQEGLELLNFFSKKSVFHRFCAYGEHLISGPSSISIETGIIPIIENFGYRQLTLFWRLSGLLRWLFGWIDRRGLFHRGLIAIELR